MSVKTLCKNCIFEQEPKTCFVGRLDKLKEIARVVEEDGHFVILDKICDWSTPRYWNNLSEAELRDLAWKVRENRILKIPFIVVTQNGSTKEEIARTVRSLQNQQVEPSLIHIINYTKIEPTTLQSLKGSTNIPITVTQVILDDFPERFIWEKVQKFTSIYYGVICAGFELPVNFIRKLDQTFNEEMNQFAYIDYDGFVEVHSTLLSHEVGGDYIETESGYKYRDKIQQWCKNNSLEHLVQKWENF